MILDIEPDAHVADGLEEEKGDNGEEGQEGEQVAHRLLLHQRVIRTAVADHDDGEGGQADVHHQILVVTRFRSDLKQGPFRAIYT